MFVTLDVSKTGILVKAEQLLNIDDVLVILLISSCGMYFKFVQPSNILVAEKFVASGDKNTFGTFSINFSPLNK